MIYALVALSLIFAFFNGYRDASSIMAGVIATRAMSARRARLLCALAEFTAPFVFGTAVARSVTTGLVQPQGLMTETIAAAMAAALLWTIFAWLIGIPSSSSHALVGGILGASILAQGLKSVLLGGLLKVILALLLAPVLGIGVSALIMHLILSACRNTTPRVNSLFQHLQQYTLVGLALAHSANDSQKSMGMIALGLLLAGFTSTFQIPLWVVAICAAAIALGASRGDWRLMRTLGRRMYIIRPVDSLTSQAAASVVVIASSLLGAPVSTSQVISMALLGAGAAERVNKVRWHVGQDMLITWVLTIPATMAVSAILVEVVKIADRFF